MNTTAGKLFTEPIVTALDTALPVAAFSSYRPPLPRFPKSIVRLFGLLARLRLPRFVLPVVMGAALSIAAAVFVARAAHERSLGTIALVAAADGFGAAWAEAPGLHFQRLADDGTARGAEVVIDLPGCAIWSLALAWSGTDYGVLWICRRGPGGRRPRNWSATVYFQRVSATGQLIGDSVCLSSARDRSFDAMLVWDGAAFAAAWKLDGNLVWAKLDAAGKIIEEPRTVERDVSPTAEYGFVGFKKGYGLAWKHDEGATSSVRLSALGSRGEKAGCVDVVRSAEPTVHAHVTLATDGRRFALAWRRSPDRALMFATVDEDRRLRSAPREVLRLGAGAAPTQLVASGGQFGIAWSDYETNQVQLARVDENGQLIGALTDAKTTNHAVDSIALAEAPNGYAVAWIDTRGLFFARIARDGKRIGDAVELGVAGAAATSCRWLPRGLIPTPS